jgi:hypothetical protein
MDHIIRRKSSFRTFTPNNNKQGRRPNKKSAHSEVRLHGVFVAKVPVFIALFGNGISKPDHACGRGKEGRGKEARVSTAAPVKRPSGIR